MNIPCMSPHGSSPVLYRKHDFDDCDICSWCGKSKAEVIDVEPLTLSQLQEEQKPWVKHNFGDRPAWMPLLGVVEELGELAHAFLKRAQGIRTNEDHDADAKDAVADIVIFLADYCSATDIDFGKVVAETWAKVKLRDWKADPATAGSKCGEKGAAV